jgi:hypothetical protein
VTINAENWRKFGETANATLFEVEPRILAVVPVEGAIDDEATAKANLETQLAYLKPKGQKAGVIIFMDPVAEQTAAARAVYRDASDPVFLACYALVGGTFFGRAVGSVFLGLSKPGIPTSMFGSFEEALEWCRAQVGKQATLG